FISFALRSKALNEASSAPTNAVEGILRQMKQHPARGASQDSRRVPECAGRLRPQSRWSTFLTSSPAPSSAILGSPAQLTRAATPQNDHTHCLCSDHAS